MVVADGDDGMDDLVEREDPREATGSSRSAQQRVVTSDERLKLRSVE